jgi:formiminoglutamase
MFEKVNLENLLGIDKKNDPKLLDWLKKDIDDSEYVIVGYPDDEGIKNNGGRKGASLAPDQIRKYFYKMRPSILSDSPAAELYDYGNLKIEKSLEQRHSTAITFIERLLDQGKTIISFGGGHDYGYVDGKSFLNFCSDSTKKPLIINFDAHLDVRNLASGITSGTPFFRLLEEDVFNFVEIGIQEQCNTKAHYEYVKAKGGHVLFLNDLYTEGQFDFKKFLRFFEALKIEDTTCFLSVDIDSFSNAFAPGCSQAFATGFHPEAFFAMFEYFIQNYYVRALGIYEVSPELDFDDHTSKLAALIAYKFLNLKQNTKKKIG